MLTTVHYHLLILLAVLGLAVKTSVFCAWNNFTQSGQLCPLGVTLLVHLLCYNFCILATYLNQSSTTVMLASAYTAKHGTSPLCRPCTQMYGDFHVKCPLFLPDF